MRVGKRFAEPCFRGRCWMILVASLRRVAWCDGWPSALALRRVRRGRPAQLARALPRSGCGGRQDRGDAQDASPFVRIPLGGSWDHRRLYRRRDRPLSLTVRREKYAKPLTRYAAAPFTATEGAERMIYEARKRAIELECHAGNWGRGPVVGAIYGNAKSVVDARAHRLVQAVASLLSADGNWWRLRG